MVLRSRAAIVMVVASGLTLAALPVAVETSTATAIDPEGLTTAVLAGVAGSARDDVWAVGYTWSHGTYHHDSLIEHWNGTAWSVVDSPRWRQTSELSAVTVISRSDAWAVGSRNRRPLALHWDGDSWTSVPMPALSGWGDLEAVAAAGPNDVWAVGRRKPDDHGDSITLIEHWDGASWSIAADPHRRPHNDELSDVDVVAVNDVVAVGSSGSHTIVERWNGTAWRIMDAAPPPKDGQSPAFYGIAADTTGAWAVGGWYNGAYVRPLTERLTADTWRTVRNRAPLHKSSELFDVSSLGPDDVWAVGSTGPYRTYTVHWDGHRWTRVKSPNPPGDPRADLWSVAAIGPSDIWTVGIKFTGQDDWSPFFMHWDGVRWRIVRGG